MQQLFVRLLRVLFGQALDCWEMFAAFFRQVKVDDLGELDQPSIVSYLEAHNHWGMDLLLGPERGPWQ
jgi:hypothetical protein